MAKIFKKLFSGDTVATYDGKVFKKLTIEEPTESIVGTWVFNDVVDFSIFNYTSTVFNINFSTEDSDYIQLKCSYITSLSTPHWRMYYTRYYSGTSTTSDTVYMQTWETGTYGSGFGNLDVHGAYKTITITGGADITNETFVTWLKANATKQ